MVTFLPEDFVLPTLVAGPRFRMRPLTVNDVVRLYDAVMSSRDRLWEQFGEVLTRPAADHTLEQCLIDVAWQQKEAQLRRSFVYTVLTTDESRALGCIYVGPTRRPGADANVGVWVRSGEIPPGLERELEEFVRGWVISAWPFKAVRFPGRDISWADWRALPRS